MSKIEELKIHLKNETKLAKGLRYLYVVVIVVGFWSLREGDKLEGDGIGILMVFIGFCLFVILYLFILFQITFSFARA